MASELELARCRERLERLSGSTPDCESIQREAIADLQRVIGFDRWCWPLGDPDSLLPLSGLAEHDFGPRVPRALELEFSGNDFAAKHVLARRPHSRGSLYIETGATLGRGPAARRYRRHGHGCMPRRAGVLGVDRALPRQK